MAYWGVGRPGTTQNASYTGTAGVITNPVGVQTYKVRIAVTTDAFVSFGAAPTATTSDVFMPAGSVEYFTITPGQKVSAIQSSAGGSVYVTEIS